MAPRLLVLLGVVGMVAVGCSGDDDVASVASTDPPAPPSVPASTGPSTSAVPTSSAPPSTTDPYADWCVVARDVESLSDEGDAVDYTDPVAVEAYLDQLVPALDEAADVAPSAIVGDVRTSAEITAAFRNALAEADYDMLTADLSIVDERGDERDAARTAIQEFNAEHCGIPIDDTDSTTDDGISFSDGSLRDQFIGQLVDAGFTLPEAACIFGEIDFSEAESLDDPSVLGPIFETCGIDADRLEEIGATPSPDAASGDFLEQALGAAGLDDDQVACVTEQLTAGSTDQTAPDVEVSEDVIVKVMLDCGVGVDQLANVDPSSLADVEQAFIDEFVAMGLSEDEATCLYDELIVGNIDGFDAEEVVAAFAACDIDEAAFG